MPRLLAAAVAFDAAGGFLEVAAPAAVGLPRLLLAVVAPDLRANYYYYKRKRTKLYTR